jgi:hypothetical protein
MFGKTWVFHVVGLVRARSSTVILLVWAHNWATAFALGLWEGRDRGYQRRNQKVRDRTHVEDQEFNEWSWNKMCFEVMLDCLSIR